MCHATIAGGVTGAAVTSDQLLALPSGGATLLVAAGAVGVEMVYLSYVQMRLVLDLAMVYGQRLDPDDPEDVLMVFGYALGAAPAEAIGKFAQRAAASGTESAVRRYIAKGTLETLQVYGRKLGLRILQRSVIKFAVPLASTAVGSSYNYLTTKSVGAIAKAHMRNRGRASEELRGLLVRQAEYALVFPAAVMQMAEADGVLRPREKDLYKAMLARMSFEEHNPEEFDRLVRDRELLLASLASIDDPGARHALIEALALMAIYDGELTASETEFLLAVADRLGIPVDVADLARRAADYKVAPPDNALTKTGAVARQGTPCRQRRGQMQRVQCAYRLHGERLPGAIDDFGAQAHNRPPRRGCRQPCPPVSRRPFGNAAQGDGPMKDTVALHQGQVRGDDHFRFGQSPTHRLRVRFAVQPSQNRARLSVKPHRSERSSSSNSRAAPGGIMGSSAG